MTFKKRILDLITFLAVSIIVSAVSGCCAYLFVKGTDGFSDLANFLTNTLVTAGLPVPALPQALALALGAALVLQIRRFFGVTRWSGPAESIFSLQYSDSSALDTRVGLGSVFAALVSCGSGAPVGQYGPVIHLGATLGKLLKEKFSYLPKLDIMMSCCIGGAITGAFNAPLAATAFVFEVMLRRYTITLLAAVALATSSAYVVNQTFFDHRLFLPLTIDQPSLLAGFLAAFVSPLCALVAWCYISSLQKLQQWREETTLSPGAAIAASALACAVIGSFVPELLGLGRQAMQNMLAGTFDLHLLAALLFGKMLITSLCIACGFYGGIVAPALFVGAATGALLAKMLYLFGLGDWTSLLLLNALAGVTAAAIGAPLSVIFLVIELTGAGINGALVVVTAYASTWITRKYLTPSYYQTQVNEMLLSVKN